MELVEIDAIMWVRCNWLLMVCSGVLWCQRYLSFGLCYRTGN